jgi:hypothetical protein
MLPALGRSLASRVDFYVHEAFHYHQRRAFTPTADDAIVGLSPIEFVRDPTVLGRPEYLTALTKEDDLLERALAERREGQLVSILRTYLAARDARLSQHADLQAIERRYERLEGTATFVGCGAANKLVQGEDGSHDRCIKRHLRERGEPVNILRLRLYSSGAILATALERLAVLDWRSRVAAGKDLHALVREAISSRQ